MYAMLAGRLPFKVENRSKNLAKLHACILKGFEMPTFLSADCQDLLCRLLDPSPSKRIKMHEILSHPWMNNFGQLSHIEIIPYKPVVDTKEIRREIVLYLMQKHDYTEVDVYDAIVHRKPVALKAIYYLIEKRLKQGLTFPDSDYNNLLLNANNKNNNEQISYKANSQFKASDHLLGLQHHQNGANLSKHNSQLLPKRHHPNSGGSNGSSGGGGNLAQRSSSQKNVDYKAMFNQMNLNNSNNTNRNSVLSTYKDSNEHLNNTGINNNNNNNNNSNSPTPDFIAAAMNPIKTTSAVSRTSRLEQQQNSSNTNVILSRKLSNNTNRVSYPQSSSSQDYVVGGVGNSGAGSRLGYYAPSSAQSNRLSQQIDENFYETPSTTTTNNATTNNRDSASNLKLSHSVAGSIRSLPSGILYRGSPERTFHINASNPDSNVNNRPASRISTTSSSAEKNYDLNGSNKGRVANYLAAKRSMTSCDIEPPSSLNNNNPNVSITKNNTIHIGSSSGSNSNAMNNKNRQLHMGKAKIDLDAQTSNFILYFLMISNYLDLTPSNPCSKIVLTQFFSGSKIITRVVIPSIKHLTRSSVYFI
jgi:hypothetical protein